MSVLGTVSQGSLLTCEGPSALVGRQIAYVFAGVGGYYASKQGGLAGDWRCYLASDCQSE
jgi:hypothetical protein